MLRTYSLLAGLLGAFGCFFVMGGATSAVAAPLASSQLSVLDHQATKGLSTDIVKVKKRRRHRGHRRRHNNNGAVAAGVALGIMLPLIAEYGHYDDYDDYEYSPRPRRSRGSGRCGYWRNRCVANWGYGNSDFYGCLRYHGC